MGRVPFHLNLILYVGIELIDIPIRIIFGEDFVCFSILGILRNQ